MECVQYSTDSEQTAMQGGLSGHRTGQEGHPNYVLK